MWNLVDLDGSLTGILPSGPSYARQISMNPTLPGICVQNTEFSHGPFPGAICQPGIQTNVCWLCFLMNKFSNA